MSAIDDVAAERERQKAVEGWTPEHDDKHNAGQLGLAAACYAAPERMTVGYVISDPAEVASALLGK